MDPEDRDLLERTFKLARDNNRMLQSMSRAALFTGLFRVLAWVLVLGGAIWLYLNFLGPSVASFSQTVDHVQTTTDAANSQFQMFRSFLDMLQHTLPKFATTTATSTR